MSEAIQAWKKLGEEFNRIDKLTAKIEYQKLQTVRKANLFNVLFCRSSKPCESKFIKTSSRHRENRYRVCAFSGNCNQQTKEKDLGRMKKYG